jgi:hypothetical protein
MTKKTNYLFVFILFFSCAQDPIIAYKKNKLPNSELSHSISIEDKINQLSQKINLEDINFEELFNLIKLIKIPENAFDLIKKLEETSQKIDELLVEQFKIFDEEIKKNDQKFIDCSDLNLTIKKIKDTKIIPPYLNNEFENTFRNIVNNYEKYMKLANIFANAYFYGMLVILYDINFYHSQIGLELSKFVTLFLIANFSLSFIFYAIEEHSPVIVWLNKHYSFKKIENLISSLTQKTANTKQQVSKKTSLFKKNKDPKDLENSLENKDNNPTSSLLENIEDKAKKLLEVKMKLIFFQIINKEV